MDLTLQLPRSLEEKMPQKRQSADPWAKQLKTIRAFLALRPMLERMCAEVSFTLEH